MKNKLSITVLLLACRICSAQNLVANGDFELYSTCPTTLGDLTANSCTNPSQGTPDYYNACAPASSNVSIPQNIQGNQAAHSGGGYCGGDFFTQPPFVPEYREYVQIELTSPLIAGSCYHFEMYVTHADDSQYSIADIGAYFSTTLLSGYPWAALPFTPQVVNTNGLVSNDTSWSLINGNFTATGGESYVIVGNFKDDAGTTFQLTDPNAGHQFSYYFVDDVSLTLCTGVNELNNVASVSISPNPATTHITITNHSPITQLKITNALGQLCYLNPLRVEANKIKIPVENFNAGIYFLTITLGDNVVTRKVVIE